MSKLEYKLYLTPDTGKQVEEATKQFRAAGRKVSRNEVIEQLIEDGFRMWRREAQVVTRVEATLAQLLDRAEKQDRVLQSILLTLAEGDLEEVQAVMKRIEGEANHA